MTALAHWLRGLNVVALFVALVVGAFAAAPLAAEAGSPDIRSAAPAARHQRLVASNPAADEPLDQPPAELRFEFAEPVQIPFTEITLTGPNGPVSFAGPLRLADGAPNILIVALPALGGGTYQVEWRTASADGHPVTGTFEFQVAEPAPAEPDSAAASGSETEEPAEDAALPATPTVPAGPATEAAPAFGVSSPGYVFVRWLTFAGTLGLLGAVAFHWLVLGSLRRRRAVTPEVTASAGRAAARVGVVAAALLLVAGVARLCAQLYALTGSLSGAPVSNILFGTVWGWGWWLQMGGAAVGLVGFAIASRQHVGWGLASVAAAAAACAPACSGHAVGAQDGAAFAFFVDVAHVLAAGGWVGGLVLLLAAGLPAAIRHGAEQRGDSVSRFVAAFSNTALVFAAIAVATGLAGMSIHIGAPADLWTSAYGRTLLAKFGALALLFGLGAYNYLRIRPALANNGSADRLKRSGSLEVVAAIAVLLVTAVLVATPPPTSDAAAHASGHSPATAYTAP